MAVLLLIVWFVWVAVTNYRIGTLEDQVFKMMKNPLDDDNQEDFF